MKIRQRDSFSTTEKKKSLGITNERISTMILAECAESAVHWPGAIAFSIMCLSAAIAVWAICRYRS